MDQSKVQKAIKQCRFICIVQTILGWILSVLGAFLAIIAIYGMDELGGGFLIVTLIILGIGVCSILNTKKKKRLMKTYPEYIARLEADPTNSIDLLAASAGKPVEAVIKNLSDMSKLGFFPNTYIDLDRKCLVFVDSKADMPIDEDVGQKKENDTGSVAVKCSGCGATNKIIKGSVGECEYCGAQISELS